MHSFCVIENHLKEVNCCTFSADYFVTCSGDKTLRVYSTRTFKELPYSPIKVFRYGVNFVIFDKQGKYLASACNDGKAHIFEFSDTEAQTIVVFRHFDCNTAQACAFSSNSNYLATGSADGSIALWDIEKKKLIKEITGHPEGNVYAVAFTPCDMYLVTGSGLGDLRVWNVSNMQITMQTQAHGDGISSCGVSCVQFSPTYHSSDPNRCYLMASCGQDNKAKIWMFNAQDKGLKFFQELTGHLAPVSFCAFSPDGRCLATSSFDKTIIVWDPITKEQLMELCGHDTLVTSVAYSPDGHLASTSYDKKVIIWKTDIDEEEVMDGNTDPAIIQNEENSHNLINLSLEVSPHATEQETLANVSSPAETPVFQSWSCDEVASWLSDQVKLGQYAEIFRENEIDGAEITSLTSEMLQKDLGITPLGHRNKILRAIKAVKGSPVTPVSASNVKADSASVEWKKVSKAPAIKITDNRPCKSDDNAPDQYLCPISREVMMNPVIASDGFTYERAMIEEWFLKGNSLSPMSNKALSSKKLIPNQTLKSLILQYIEDRQTKSEKWVETKPQT